MEVSVLSIPTILYGRYARLGCNPEHWRDVISSMAGNPNGMGLSTVPYIYCMKEQDRDKNKLFQSLFYLEIEFEWPMTGKLLDETKDTTVKQQTYETYHQSNYIGVLRSFKDAPRYVIMDPIKYITHITDKGKDKLLYKREINIQKRLIEEDNSGSQNRLNELMYRNLGIDYVDSIQDYFCLSEIARRKRMSVQNVEEDVSRIISRITVNTTSGCWVSTRRNDYKRTFWLSLGGVHFKDMFYFPSELEGERSEPLFIKNRNILHSHLCELILGKEHSKCCRPLHLRLGTSAENAIHIKIRKNIEQLFDLSPSQLRTYTAHLDGIANIMMKQQQIVTREEETVNRNRKKRKRVTVWDDMSTNQSGSYVTGQPHMGDVKAESLCVADDDGLHPSEEYEIDLQTLFEPEYHDYLINLADKNQLTME